MDISQTTKQTDEVELQTPQTSTPADVSPEDVTATASTNPTQSSTQKQKRRSQHKKSKHARKASKVESDSSEDESDDSSESSESSADETRKARKRRKAKKAKAKASKHNTSESDTDSESDANSTSDEGSEDDRTRRRTKRKSSGKRSRRRDEPEDEDEDEDHLQDESTEDEIARLREEIARLELRRSTRSRRASKTERLLQTLLDGSRRDKRPRKAKSKSRKRKAKKASTLEYKRVDQLWDNTIHNYKLTESAEDQEDEFEQYVFTVRRTFDWENKYRNTVVDIKSKSLREALQEVMKDVKGISLVEEQPSIDPNMLFLYLEEMRAYRQKTLKAKIKAEKKRKNKRKIKTQRDHLKVLIGYLDQDYEETKKTLYPMLEAGNITFDLIWALFKPNVIAYTSTYGSHEDPRCFKVDYANRESSFMRGEWYCIEGTYLEYDGKSFGLGNFEVDVDAFKGPRKITSLACYPLSNHQDPEGVKKQILERSKHFVSMEGMNYRFHKGLAFMKKKKTVAKVNINGRIMVDPAIFRRINPNYPISLIKPKEDAVYPEDESDDDCSCGDGSDSEGEGVGGPQNLNDDTRERTKYKVVFDREKKAHVVQVPVDNDGNELQVENIDKLAEGADSKREFTEEELLIASPVVLGFAFSEKLWLEFTISGVREIEWNKGAFDSLVLPDSQKSIVRALVESHKFHAAKTIDDVVQGKGRGLVSVLHGPPGTGKTLTAEGIAELLRCPLYMVSAGELGTEAGRLEGELQKILDIAHSWGAVLLLDEADVFLEKREVHDIHRNALVSIFLRLLEYFQGILFLTTNRVTSFDEAFQSRIHLALRYGELTTKAKKTVWKMFLQKVLDMESANAASSDDPQVDGASAIRNEKRLGLTEEDYEALSRRSMNGRQIKNAVRTAQALAVNEKTVISMEHIKRVLEVAESFDRDLRGGSGYTDAMRSYT